MSCCTDCPDYFQCERKDCCDECPMYSDCVKRLDKRKK
jgi:hypothetical protein